MLEQVELVALHFVVLGIADVFALVDALVVGAIARWHSHQTFDLHRHTDTRELHP